MKTQAGILLSLFFLNLTLFSQTKQITQNGHSISTPLEKRNTPQAHERWQQRVSYKMEIDMNVETNQFTGKQSLAYTNHSPDTLNQVFYHLYYNAFQPGSMMDVHSKEMPDLNSEIQNNILYLDQHEIGFIKIKSLSYRGDPIDFMVQGTILEVKLPSPILPGETVTFDTEFWAQVPLQSIRTGRDNIEGIEYSMAQWYPKLCEYDYEGWHANPYVGHEFYGVWGDYELILHIAKEYVVAATGYLQNPNQIGHGYEDKHVKVKKTTKEKLSWHFIAPNVHDFVWAADTKYVHTKKQVPNGPMLHFFYQKNPNTKYWGELPKITSAALEVLNEVFGKYPYDQYSVIQGGHGGMEYPMATLILGHSSSLEDLVSLTVHELTHSWYQMVLGSNESLYSWMDEGFTTFVSNFVLDIVYKNNSLNPHAIEYIEYLQLANSKMMEPMSTHADHFTYNTTYWTSAYARGAIALNQLSYIIGEETFYPAMLRYYNTWKFKHPNPRDFKRVMEKEAQLELDWYFEYWINSTHTIDYEIASVEKYEEGTEIILQKNGKMPMPLDILISYKDGSQELYYIPLGIMRGEKGPEKLYGKTKRNVVQDWPWTNPSYSLKIDALPKQIKRIEIDPSYRMAETNRKNNHYPKSGLKVFPLYGGNKTRDKIVK